MKNAYEAPNGWAASIVALIEALLLAMIASGMLEMDNESLQLWVNVAVTSIAVIAPIVGFYWTNRRTTPMVQPKDEDGAPLLRSDGTVPMAQMNYEFRKQSK